MNKFTHVTIIESSVDCYISIDLPDYIDSVLGVKSNMVYLGYNFNVDSKKIKISLLNMILVGYNLNNPIEVNIIYLSKFKERELKLDRLEI